MTTRKPPISERRASHRIPVEGNVLIWRSGGSAPQAARMRDVSAGGAFLATAPLPVGEEVRVEIDGDCSSFTMDAVVTRSPPVRGAEGSVAVRFLDRDSGHYAEWLQDECVRLATWMCRDNAPLMATSEAVIPESRNDPTYIPIQPVLWIIQSQPGTSLDDLFGLETFHPMQIRIAVGRLLESRALAVMQPVALPRDAPAGAASPAGGIERVPWSAKVRGAAMAALVAALLVGLTLRNQGFAVNVETPPAPAIVAGGARVSTVYALSRAGLRSGPGDSFPVVAVTVPSEKLLVDDKRGEWYQLAGDTDAPRWIHESLVRVRGSH